MGVIGTGIFDNDEALDVRDEYRERIEDGVEDAEATRSTLAKFRSYFDDPESGPVCILALAVTQSKIGRLDPDIRSRALAAIESGADLAVWEREDPKSLPKRRAALEKVRAQLVGSQPARKRLRPRRKKICGLVAGDGLALTTPSGLALLRVVRVKDYRVGEDPILEELQFRGSDLPTQSELDQLKAIGKSKIALGGEHRFSAFIGNGPYNLSWEQAGFQKVARFAPRPGDQEAEASTGVAWIAIAGRLRGEERWM
jgi:hypothetical protein